MLTTQNGQKKSPADDLICPITLELPWDPVTAEDGRVYDRHAIEEHFQKCSSLGQVISSPLTKECMGQKLLPAHHIKSLIETLVENGMIVGDLAITWNGKMKQQKELEELNRKAEGGDPEAMLSLGGFYDSGEHWSHGMTKDDYLALTWYKKAHEQGNITGTALLGDFFCTGRGGVTNYSTGIMYLSMAACQGSRLGAYYLGMAMAGGHLAMVAGRIGMASGQLRTVQGHRNGIDVDKKEAIYWLEKAVGNSPDCIDCLTDEAAMVAQQTLQELGEIEVSKSTGFMGGRGGNIGGRGRGCGRGGRGRGGGRGGRGRRFG